jgi:integrase
MREFDSTAGDESPRGYSVDPADEVDFDLLNKRLLEVEGLPDRQLVLIERELERFRAWMLTTGKDPNRGEPLAESTVDNYIFRLQQFLIFAWANSRQVTTRINPELADSYVEALDEDAITTEEGEPYAESGKRKLVDAVSKWYLWRHHTAGAENWNPDIIFSQDHHESVSRFTKLDRTLLREGVLGFESLAKYNDLSPEERDRRKAYLAQKLGKPKSDITMADWEEVRNSWKVPAMVWLSLDIGPRPIDINRLNESWVIPAENTVRIPMGESSKNERFWPLRIHPDTTWMVNLWREQRSTDPTYDDTEALFLNRNGNRYDAGNLADLVRRLCADIGLSTENRRITWYSFRHSAGTYIANEGDSGQARHQLQHKNNESLANYNVPPAEAVAETLEQTYTPVANIDQATLEAAGTVNELADRLDDRLQGDGRDRSIRDE